MITMTPYPRRIICLTEETTETLYLLGQQDRIVGVSGYSSRPPEARAKPKISAFKSAKYDAILGLAPDLILGFSNVQAEIARELVLRGQNVMIFNQRSIAEILDMILLLGRITSVPEKAEALVSSLQADLAAVRESAARLPRRPRVFFEEWKDPLISGIRWVDELIELAGGEPVYPELRRHHAAQDRVVDPQAVIERDPEIVMASWCGMKVNKPSIYARPGWSGISALQAGHVYEIKSAYILQPGPAALTEGVRQLHAIISRVAGGDVPPALLPGENTDPDLARPEVSA
jgi:iron complex transport system substrate-binding protein